VVALILPVLVGVAVGLALGGRLERLASLELRARWLFFGAIGLQLIAFPLAVFPWRTDRALASALWVASYGLLVAAAALNRRITGVPLVATGMALNLAAIVANGGTMPVRPSAMHEAGRVAVTQASSTALESPRLSWLSDRWAAPDWIPFANVFSVGDVVIAVGSVVMVVAAMGVRLPRAPGVQRPA
jgi:hypothetical protein